MQHENRRRFMTKVAHSGTGPDYKVYPLGLSRAKLPLPQPPPPPRSVTSAPR
jgi:hypothetical protein